MTTLVELWPLFGLRVTCGPLELRAVRDDDLPHVLEAVEAGIHEATRMPFLFPWTDAMGDTLRVNTLQHYWRARADVTPDKWSLPLGVWRDGGFVGIQEVATTNFGVTRTGETGSWLGRRFQGQGVGTLMRQAICALCFDHVSFTELTSGAFTDNPASRAVSRKVGYVDNGRVRYRRRDELAVNQSLLLTPEAFVRPGHPVGVEGVAGVRRLLGIDDSI
ncbi:MAG: GNAT family N-acetyltransferase [Marmoricola sp.]